MARRGSASQFASGRTWRHSDTGLEAVVHERRGGKVFLRVDGKYISPWPESVFVRMWEVVE